jgi:hypothetical protein
MEITDYAIIMIAIILLGASSYFMFWLGNKQGISEGRRQVLEEDIKREQLKIIQTAENLMILNLYDSNTQIDVIKGVQDKQLLRGTQALIVN